MTLASLLDRSQKDRESWKYTDLKTFGLQKFGAPQNARVIEKTGLPSIEPEAESRHQIVFVNGELRKDLSLEGDIMALLSHDENEGYRLKVDSETCLVTKPIELIYVSDGGALPAEMNSKLVIEVGASGRLTLIEHHMAPLSDAPTAALFQTNIILGAQAKLVHGTILSGGDRGGSFSTTNVSVESGAFYDHFLFVRDGNLVRYEISAALIGKMAQCSLSGLLLLRGRAHADIVNDIQHKSPFCNSRQTYKSVVDGKAEAVLQGKVTVDKDAQKSDARQLSRALLLSDQAEVNVKPELKIFADDVKCSHGATLGALDEEARFYLSQRGLSESEAKALLVRAFACEIIDEIKVPQWQNYCQVQAEAWCEANA